MSLTVLTNASSGAPRNSGTNGDLCALLDWALVQEGWAIEYTATNARVYRPASGNRLRLHVRHDSAVSGAAQRALVRGCESASSATSITDTFPLAAQVVDANSNWLISTVASTTDRPFIILVTPTWMAYLSQAGGVANEWTIGWFGDLPAEYSGDTWNTAILVRGQANNTVSSGGIAAGAGTNLAGSTLGLYWARDITGATKSSVGMLCASATALGAMQGGVAARAGYLNAVYREPIGVSDFASGTTAPSTLALIKRGWLPQLWNPLHLGRGSLSDTDTFTDTAYDPTASFRALSSGAGAGVAFIIVEETDTWSPP